MLAMGAMRAVFDAGLRVPEDVAIIGIDDFEEGRYSRPTLSTVSLDTPSSPARPWPASPPGSRTPMPLPRKSSHRTRSTRARARSAREADGEAWTACPGVGAGHPSRPEPVGHVGGLQFPEDMEEGQPEIPQR